MNAIRGVVKDGRVELASPHDWPDGTEVEVRPAEREEVWGMREEDWDDSPEGVGAWIEWYESLEPVPFIDEESWQQARREQREFELATFEERAEKLRRMWE